VTGDDLGDRIKIGIRVRIWATICALERAGNDEPNEHATKSNEEGRATSKPIEVEDGRKGEGNVENVLNR
jgi:hypothetical protein